MATKTKKTLLALSAALILPSAALVGCGKSDEVANEIDERATELSIDDQWASSCKNVVLDLFGLSSEVEEYDLGASLSKTTTYFGENNCSTPVIRVVENGSYEVGGETAPDAHALDMRFDSVSITPMNEAGQKILNTLNACGINDWTIGQSRDVTAKTSDDPVLARCWTKTPRSSFDLVRVSSDQMLLGLNSGGRDRSTPEKRPTEIDNSVVFSRK